MRIIIFILLFFSLQSQGQIIRANPFYRPYAAPCSYLLDQYSGAAAAYSLRKLDCDYAGSAIRVRRSNDNAEQDIGFTSNGDLDTASLKTFVSTNSGYVTTWYDQSGNANNAVQTTSNSQPRIVNTGTVERLNGLPAINVINASDNYFSFSTIILSDFTILTVTKKSSTSADKSTILYEKSSSYAGDDIDNNGNPTLFNISYIIRGSNTSASGGEDSQHLSYYNRNSNKASGEKNNDSNTETIVSTNIFSPLLLFLYSASLPYSYDGYAQEIIIYDSDKKANKASIKSNINSYYSIY